MYEGRVNARHFWYHRSMIRTRDFLLFVVSVAFLLFAIGTTIVWEDGDAAPAPADLFWESAAAPAAAGVAIDTAEPTLDRAERLAAMRAAVADYDLTQLIPQDAVSGTDEPSAGAATGSDAIESTPEGRGPERCPDYTTFTRPWPASAVSVEVMEGARLVVVATPAALQASGTPTETVLAQLPVRQFSTTRPSCLPSDVVGIAQDGSLIKNDEINIYRIFSEATVIGYALDGFPIYGMSDRRVDRCGGAVVDGQYGYYLSAERSTILSCFSAPPVSI